MLVALMIKKIQANTLMPVNMMMCPIIFFRIVGSTALIMLTGPKKLVSN